MRWKTLGIAAVAITVVGLLGFQIVNLEQRVARLSEQLGAPHEAGALDHPATAATRSSESPNGKGGLEQRLAALEKRVAALNEAIAARPQQPADSANTLHDEEAIISVMQREAGRVRDVQLEWHRARWIEHRQQQLIAFATAEKLTPAQTSALDQALQREIDRMITVLKNPAGSDDPDQAASDWAAVLAETDERATQVLSPEQRELWTQVRAWERKIMWPWLPQNTTAQR